MAASIKDVAKRAGVSISTVSRIINNTANVDESKAKAVREAIAYYQYEPNQFGRGLVKQSAQMIGVYFQQAEGSMLDSSYNLELLRGMEETLSRENYSLVLIPEKGEYIDHPECKPAFYQYIQTKRIDGLLLSGLSSRIMGDTVFRELLEQGYPMSYIGKKVHAKGLNIYAQFERYNVQMIRLLYEFGHRKIVYIYHADHSHYLDAVCENVRTEMPDAELMLVPQSELMSRQKGLQLMKKYLKEAGYTAICAPNMQAAGKLLGYLTELEISVPQQVSLLSVEHQKDEGTAFYPALSAFYVPARTMGAHAAKQLMQAIRGEKIDQSCVEYESVRILRDSLAERKAP